MKRVHSKKQRHSCEMCGETFQDRVLPWLLECFGAEIANDRTERNHRFLEEALELVQSLGCTRSEAQQLVDYTFGRPPGDPSQESGGVMITLAALCLASKLDMHEAGETELARIWTKVETIRAKQAAKPRHSPLPAASHSGVPREATAEMIERAAWAMAETIAERNGNVADAQDWMNDTRREEAKAALAASTDTAA